MRFSAIRGSLKVDSLTDKPSLSVVGVFSTPATRRAKFLELGGEHTFRPRRRVVPKRDEFSLFESSDEQMRPEHFTIVKKQQLIGKLRRLWGGS